MRSRLVYFRAPYYGSALGRFSGPNEPFTDHAADPQRWNLYGYVRNNPLKNVEPLGLDRITTAPRLGRRGRPSLATNRGAAASCSRSFSLFAQQNTGRSKLC